MDVNKRFAMIAQASPEVLERIDAILEGGLECIAAKEEDCRLITISEACRMLGLEYPSFHRRMKEGCFDVVDASGRAMIRRQSVIEYSKGLRKPTPEALEAREQRNALRRKPSNNEDLMHEVWED